MGNQSVVICGNDEYMVSTLARQWVENICPLDRQTTDLEVHEGRVGTVDEVVHVLDGVLASLRTVGLFSAHKVVWLRDVTFLKQAVLMKNAKVKELLASIASDVESYHLNNIFLYPDLVLIEGQLFTNQLKI